MRALVLWADDSSANLGVRVLGRGSRAIIEQVWPDAEVVYANSGIRPPEVPWGSLRSLARERLLNRLGMREWFASFDLVWDTRSGDSFADIYGWARHARMSAVYELALRDSRTGILAPQTIGPFRERRSRVLARRTLSRSQLVFARDDISAQASADLGRPVDATTSDLVFAIPAAQPSGRFDVLLNPSGLLWSGSAHVDSTAYRQTVRDLIGGLRDRGRTVTLLAHVLENPTPDTDVATVQLLAAEFGGLDVVIPKDLDDARAAIAGADLLIGSRMHACLNALSQGVPAIALAYSRKFAPLLSALGWDHTIDLATSTDAASRALELSGDPTLRESALTAQQRGRASLQPLIDALGKVSPA